MQASSTWTAPTGTLGRIVAEARQRAVALLPLESELRRGAVDVATPPPFAAALRTSSVAVVAEVKRRSPSKGWIKAGISADQQATDYERGGAAAISVLTEPEHFGGSTDDLLAVRNAVRIPALKKDFHVHPIQLIEARSLGASAALLIARALSPDDLREMTAMARAIGLEVLVEVRDEDELGRALDAGASIVGINNRNLETLEIDRGTAERLLPMVPESVVAIAESGMTSRSDIERVAGFGADAVLVGSAISGSPDPTAAVRELCGVPRVSRER